MPHSHKPNKTYKLNKTQPQIKVKLKKREYVLSHVLTKNVVLKVVLIYSLFWIPEGGEKDKREERQREGKWKREECSNKRESDEKETVSLYPQNKNRTQV